MNIKPFGKIDIENLEEFYEGSLDIQGNLVDVELIFDSDTIKTSEIKKLKNFIKNIKTFAQKALDELSKDYDLGENSQTVRQYLQHHLDQFSEDEIMNIFGSKDVDKDLFFTALSIKTISLYPEDSDSYAVFNAHLPEGYTNYSMAVTFNDKGKLSSISMES